MGRHRLRDLSHNLSRARQANARADARQTMVIARAQCWAHLIKGGLAEGIREKKRCGEIARRVAHVCFRPPRFYSGVCSAGADPGILAVASDPSLTLIGSFPNKGTFALVAARNLKNMQQLGGK